MSRLPRPWITGLLALLTLAILAGGGALLVRSLRPAPIAYPIDLSPLTPERMAESASDFTLDPKYERRIRRMTDAETRLSAGPGESLGDRVRWFYDQRAYPLKSIPVEVHDAALQAELASGAAAGPSAVSWTNLGPNPLNDITYGGYSEQDASGRALSIAIHPTNANLVLIGAAQGGIWRSTDGGTSWTGVGDAMPSLAVKVIRFAPSNPNIVYAGTGEPHGSTSIYGQGVFKSTDAGLTWSALPPNGAGWDFRYASVSGLQVHPTDPNTVFVTTADINTYINYFNPASAPQTGIFKSTNGGTSWTLLKAATTYTSGWSSFQGNAGFMDLELAKNNPNRLYASEYQGGVWRSDNGGSSWNLVNPLKSGGGADLLAPVANYAFLNVTNSESRFYILTRFQLQGQYPEFTRIELGLAQSNPDVLYAGLSTILLLDANGDGNFTNGVDIITEAGLVFKTTNGGSSWTWLGDWPRNSVPNYCATQCDYDNTVEVNPNNPNDVLIGGSANYPRYWPDPIASPTRYLMLPWRGMVHRSLNGGTSFTDITPHCVSINANPEGFTLGGLPVYGCSPIEAARVIHPDVHGIAYDPANANRLWVVNDGGIYRAAVGGGGTSSADYTWSNINANLSTLQFYFFDVHPTNANLFLGGLQDNSNAYWNGSTWEGWGFGDGIFGAFDPNSPNFVYMGTQFNVHRHDSGGNKRALDGNGNPANGWNLGIFQVQNGDWPQFITPFEIDPVNSATVYAGSATGLYRSTNRGDAWTGRLNPAEMDGSPTAISVSPKNGNNVFVGTSTGEVYYFDFNASTNSARGAALPSRYVTDVEASPNAASTVYVTLSGYNANTPATPGKVFKSTNLGVTWSNISGNLPDVPVSTLAIDPANEQRMWVGTDVGMFMTTDGGATWSSYRLNMPVVAITDSKYNAATKYLTVVTHGRGAWRVNPDFGQNQNQKVFLPQVAKNASSQPAGPTPTPTRTSTPGGGPSPTPTRTNTPGPGPSSTPTRTPTPTPTRTPTPTQPPSLPVFANADFELGSNGDWTEFSLLGYNIIVNQGLPLTPRSGQWLAWLGGDNDEISYIEQDVAIPNGSGPTYVKFYFQIGSVETNCNPLGWSDAFLLYINGVQQGGYVLCDSFVTSAWTLGGLDLDLASYAGQTVTFSFEVLTSPGEISSFFMDDVFFASTPPSAPVQSLGSPADGPVEKPAPTGSDEAYRRPR